MRHTEQECPGPSEALSTVGLGVTNPDWEELIHKPCSCPDLPVLPAGSCSWHGLSAAPRNFPLGSCHVWLQNPGFDQLRHCSTSTHGHGKCDWCSASTQQPPESAGTGEVTPSVGQAPNRSRTIPILGQAFPALEHTQTPPRAKLGWGTPRKPTNGFSGDTRQQPAPSSSSSPPSSNPHAPCHSPGIELDFPQHRRERKAKD